MDKFEKHFGVNQGVAKGYVQSDTIYVKLLNTNDASYWLCIFMQTVQL